MFLPCPHCGYLIALILPSPAGGAHRPTVRCPRCKTVLSADPRADNPESPATSASALDVPASSAHEADADADADADAGGDGDGDGDGEHEGMAAETSHAAIIESIAPGSGPIADAVLAGDTDPSATTLAAPEILVSPVATASDPRATRARRAPSFVRSATTGKAARLAWPWYAAIGLLGLLLALQLLLAQRHELAASARWRPLVAGLCNALACAIPPWREPGAFTMLSRNVQPSRAVAGVLVVDARFRNDARWPQPWPELLLSLSDVEGRTLATRAFTPAQYRQRRAGVADQLAPGQIANARLQVREPAPGVVAFTFDFQ